MAKRGDHVNAVVESGQDPEIAHYLEDNGDKDTLQLADGTVVDYARRDPSDYDEAGGGQTWYPL
jgi:hypothetical protein